MPNWTKEQLDAINLDNTNIIVSAGAGSGKTAVLSERVIRKLKQGVHINELLILTFTNAAAKEMKERIRKKIIKEGLVEELRYIDSAYITTFDSYSLSVLKKYHYLLNIDKNIKIADSDIIRYKKEEILNNIFDEYYSSDNNLFNKLISDYCIKDDELIKNYILNISSKLDLKLNLDNYLDDYIDNYYSDNYLNSVIDDLNNNLRLKIDNIELLLKNLSYYVDEKFNEKIKDSLKNLLKSKSYDEIVINLNVSLPILRTEYEEAKELKSAIKDEIDSIKKKCVFTSEEDIKNNIKLTEDYVKIIIEIIKELNNRIMDFKKENDIYEFNDVAKLSIKIIEDNDDIREEIKNSLNEIMIDEYQDTNDIQEAFISLISNNNVYMVGDIKQSIYRFRNANPYIFKNKYDKYSNKDGGIKIDLNKNFRSREETLDNINLFFDLIMDDSLGGANYKSTHRMIFGNNSYNEIGKTDQNNNFEIYNYDYNKDLGFTREETEIFLIANDIKEKIDNKYKIFDKDTGIVRDCNYNDFVILLDRSRDFSLYKKIFEYMGIPLSILRDESVNDEVILTIIKNFLISVTKINNGELDNEFKHAFTSILRSFIFEYNDEKIFDLYLNNSFKKDDIYLELKSINIESLTIKEVLEIIIDKFNIIEKIIKIGNINNNLVTLEYLFNYIESKEDLGFTIYSFIDYLSDILDSNYEIKFSSMNEDSLSVKLMTIHKSKGLEYSICYYAGLYNEFNMRDVTDRFLYDNRYGIVTPYFDEGIGETIYKYLIKENLIKEEVSEKIRLLYVAFTRAKEKIILIADLNKDEYNTKDENGVIDLITRLNYRSFLDIVISIKKDLDKYIVNKEDIFVTKDYENIKTINYKDYIEDNKEILNVVELEKDTNIKEDEHFSKKQNKLLSKEETDLLKYGSDVHYKFEIDDFDNPKFDEVKKFLELYNKKPINTYKEYEFMYEEGNTIYHGFIDLMFEYDKNIDIIDYKLSNVDDEAYIKQLNGYKDYIKTKIDKEVDIYLYSINKNELKKL